ncbi:MAG: DUF6516 family protein [Betaproteobacteria bacterium]|nr:DUF6516 family protein [Betaproteobacteria bacterium]
MKADLLKRERIHISGNRFAEVVIWALPSPLPGSVHSYKYRLAYVIDEICVLRYDNEAGKGDHRHMGEAQAPYLFTTLDALLDDFWDDLTKL